MGKFHKVVMGSFAMCGLCFQVLHMSLLFFAYPTTIRVEQVRSSQIDPLTICFCVPYAVIHHQPNISDRLTIAEIFSRTPAFNDVISSCRKRQVSGRLDRQQSDYASKYTSLKVYTRDSVCYLMEPEDETVIPMGMVSHAIDETFICASD